MAVGHKIIVASYHILKNSEKYKEPELNTKSEKARKKSIRNYLNKIEALRTSNEDLMQMFENQKNQTQKN